MGQNETSRIHQRLLTTLESSKKKKKKKRTWSNAFRYVKVHILWNLKCHNSFQNNKATHIFVPSYLIFKLQQEFWTSVICASVGACQKVTLRRIILNLESKSFESISFSQ